jgi:hypothetical protein
MMKEPNIIKGKEGQLMEFSHEFQRWFHSHSFTYQQDKLGSNI